MFHVLRARAVVILPFADSPFKHCGLASCWLELTFRLSLICCASGGLHRPLVHDTADVLPNTPTAHNTEGVTQERSGQPLLSERFAAAEGTRFPVAGGQDGRGERKEPHGWQHPLRLPSLRDVNWTMHSPAHWMQPSQSVSQSKPFLNKSSKHRVKVILTVLVKGVGVCAGVLRTSLASRGCPQPIRPLPALTHVFF